MQNNGMIKIRRYMINFHKSRRDSGNKAEMLDTDKVGYLSVHYILQLSEKRLGLPE